jgi:hypothetical protein
MDLYQNKRFGTKSRFVAIEMSTKDDLVTSLITCCYYHQDVSGIESKNQVGKMLQWLRSQRRVMAEPVEGSTAKDRHRRFVFKWIEHSRSNYFPLPLELQDVYPNIPEGQQPPAAPVRTPKETPAPKPNTKGPKPQMNFDGFMSRGEMQLIERKRKLERARSRKAQQSGKRGKFIAKRPRGEVEVADEEEEEQLD